MALVNGRIVAVAGIALAAALPVGSGLIGWGAIQAQQAAQDARLISLENNQIRVSELEANQAALAEKVDGLGKSVDQLVQRLDRLLSRPARDFDEWSR